MNYLDNLLVGTFNKLKTAGIIAVSVCTGIVGIVGAAFIAYSIVHAMGISSTTTPTTTTTTPTTSIIPPLDFSLTTDTSGANITYKTISKISYETFISTQGLRGLIINSSDFTGYNITFRSNVAANTIVKFDVEIPIVCNNLRVYKPNNTGFYYEYTKKFYGDSATSFVGTEIIIFFKVFVYYYNKSLIIIIISYYNNNGLSQQFTCRTVEQTENRWNHTWVVMCRYYSSF